jgi:hypothetical protein
MNASSALGASPSASARIRRMVEAPTRIFRWLFALSFLDTYLKADFERWRMLHVTRGYTLAELLTWRVLNAM